MRRFRLRFLLQEFDLTGPEILIGRSSECHITIEDPLVSRRHAKIAIRDGEAYVSDAGSRNGVRVNGRLVRSEQLLRDGDKLRLGTQEFVFTVVGGPARAPRPTGYMRLCHACGTTYPEGAASCPNCGAPALTDEDTVSGASIEPKRGWAFQLLGEVIERALASGRAVEAERLMRRAAKEIDERLGQGERLEPGQVASVASSAVRLARLVGSSDWLAWALTLHRRHDLMLSEEVIDRLEELDVQAFPDLPALVDSFLAWYRPKQTEGGRRVTAELSRLVRLERFRRR